MALRALGFLSLGEAASRRRPCSLPTLLGPRRLGHERLDQQHVQTDSLVCLDSPSLPRRGKSTAASRGTRLNQRSSRNGRCGGQSSWTVPDPKIDSFSPSAKKDPLPRTSFQTVALSGRGFVGKNTDMQDCLSYSLCPGIGNILMCNIRERDFLKDLFYLRKKQNQARFFLLWGEKIPLFMSVWVRRGRAKGSNEVRDWC